MKKVLLFMLMIFVNNGCATLMKGDTSAVSINSTPPAYIYINGQNYGATPRIIELKSDRIHNVAFKRQGYKDTYATIDKSIGGFYVLMDVLFSFVGLIIDAATGNWYELDEQVFVNMEPETINMYFPPPPPFQ